MLLIAMRQVPFVSSFERHQVGTCQHSTYTTPTADRCGEVSVRLYHSFGRLSSSAKDPLDKAWQAIAHKICVLDQGSARESQTRTGSELYILTFFQQRKFFFEPTAKMNWEAPR